MIPAPRGNQSQKTKAATAAGKSCSILPPGAASPTETFSETRQRLQQTVVDVPEVERVRARLELARVYFAYGNGEKLRRLFIISPCWCPI